MTAPTTIYAPSFEGPIERGAARAYDHGPARVFETVSHVYVFDGSARVDSWQRGPDAYTWERCAYVPWDGSESVTDVAHRIACQRQT